MPGSYERTSEYYPTQQLFCFNTAVLSVLCIVYFVFFDFFRFSIGTENRGFEQLRLEKLEPKMYETYLN